mgnify:CR=1 FL=1
MPGDVLSQSEIDALLAGVMSGDVDADTMKNSAGGKKVKVYDFKRCSRETPINFLKIRSERSTCCMKVLQDF